MKCSPLWDSGTFYETVGVLGVVKGQNIPIKGQEVNIFSSAGHVWSQVQLFGSVLMVPKTPGMIRKCVGVVMHQ